MMKGTSGASRFASSRTATPSMPGIRRSLMTRSKADCAKASRAGRPASKASIVCPLRRSADGDVAADALLVDRAAEQIQRLLDQRCERLESLLGLDVPAEDQHVVDQGIQASDRAEDAVEDADLIGILLEVALQHRRIEL